MSECRYRYASRNGSAIACTSATFIKLFPRGRIVNSVREKVYSIYSDLSESLLPVARICIATLALLIFYI